MIAFFVELYLNTLEKKRSQVFLFIHSASLPKTAHQFKKKSSPLGQTKSARHLSAHFL
jgi:hypothetical protein